MFAFCQFSTAPYCGADLRILLSHSAFLSIFLRTYLGAGCRLFESPYLRAVLRKKAQTAKIANLKKIFGDFLNFAKNKKNADLYKSAFLLREGNFGCKPDFVVSEETGIHLSDPLRSLPSRGCDIPNALERATPRPMLSCTGLGFHCPPGLLRAAVGSYPAFSPLPLSRRFVFCCTFHARTFRRAPRFFKRNPALWCPDFPPADEPPANARRKFPKN